MNLNKRSESIINNSYDTLPEFNSELLNLYTTKNDYINSMFKHAKIGTILTGDDFQKLHLSRLYNGRTDAFMNDKIFDTHDVFIKHKTGWIRIEPYNVKIVKDIAEYCDNDITATRELLGGDR